MSVNYASGLSEYPNKGVCGLPEKFDSEDEIKEKSALLADWIKQANGLVAVHTGAGISTACGIPDFRGPRGVWTLEQKNEKPTFNLSFESARPSLTHMALVALEEAGYLSVVITQNVDGLHLRSGFPRNRLAILHGDMFLEECDLCRTLYQRSKPVASVGLKRSGIRCKTTRRHGRGQCRGYLRDTILDWEDQLPTEDLDFAYEQSQKALLSICLGTSLRIVPGGELPLLTKKKKKKNKGRSSDPVNEAEDPSGRIAIVNLQVTKRDRDADLKIHSYVDKVMESVCMHLGVVIPKYTSPKLCLESRHTLPTEIRRWNLLPSEEANSLSPAAKRSVESKEDNSYIPETKFLRHSSPKLQRMKKEAGSSHNADVKPNSSSKKEKIEVETQDFSEDSNKTEEMQYESGGSNVADEEEKEVATASRTVETKVETEDFVSEVETGESTLSPKIRKEASEIEASAVDPAGDVNTSDDGCQRSLKKEGLEEVETPASGIESDLSSISDKFNSSTVDDVSKKSGLTEIQ